MNLGFMHRGCEGRALGRARGLPVTLPYVVRDLLECPRHGLELQAEHIALRLEVSVGNAPDARGPEVTGKPRGAELFWEEASTPPPLLSHV